MPGTRVKLMNALDQWLDDPNGPPVYWLNGMAGTGKSTIADSLYILAHLRKVLGAGYFCSRDFESARDVRKIVPTIAYQLAHNLPSSYRDALVEVLKEKPSPALGTVEEQLTDLILTPLRDAPLPHPFVIIIDALDECNGDPSSFIQFLLRHAHKFQEVGIKIFVSSRPIEEISTAFKTDGTVGNHARRILHDEPLTEVQHDIRLFVKDRLMKIQHECQRRGRPLYTCIEEDVEVIVKLAGALFIFAATVCRSLLQGLRFRSPRIVLERMASSSEASGHTTGQAELDKLYRSIFDHAVGQDEGALDAHTKHRLRNIVGAIVLASVPLSVHDLDNLLGKDESTDTRLLLEHLQSVIALPEDDITPIRVFHASFEDYVTDEARAHPDFYVDRPSCHASLATRCLEVMQAYLIKDNLCGLPPHEDYSNVGDLADRRREHIPLVLEYACWYWSYHLNEASLSGSVLSNASELTSALHTFTSTLLLRWIDVLAITRNLDKCVPMLVAARKTLSVCF